MEFDNASKEGEELPLPPPFIPPDVVPMKEKKEKVQMARPGFARKGQRIPLLTNHSIVFVRDINECFFHYSVNLKYEDGQPVYGKGIRRKVIEKMQQIYNTELGKKDLAYDGASALFTIGPLAQKNNLFTVVLDGIPSNKLAENGSPGEGDNERAIRSYQENIIKVEISFAAEIHMQSIIMELMGQETKKTQEALRVLNIILRQHAAKQGFLLVRQSFFHDNNANYTDLGGDVLGCRGFHSSFHLVQDGLSLNIDASTTTIVRPGPVIEFLIANQNVKNPFQVDWAKAKRVLKNLRVEIGKMECKIYALSELPCNQQTFTLRQRGDSGDKAMEITVYEYFVRHKGIPLRYSAKFPCINIMKSKRQPVYFPIELCNLISLQRYTKALTVHQRAVLVKRSRQTPQQRISYLTTGLKYSKYDTDPVLQACGVFVSTNFTQVEGRVLQAPKLIVGDDETLIPRNGRWNLSSKKFIAPAQLENWYVVNFSAQCDIRGLIRDLIRCGRIKGISIKQPSRVLEENPSMRRAPPPVRVEDMFDQILMKEHPKFFLCLLSERKKSTIYCPWKRKCLVELGIVTQCIVPTRINDQYLTNLLLKINAKLGGMNSLLQLESINAFLTISKVATVIFGMAVSHGPPGRSDVPSITAVVNSRQWPLITKYRASVRTQSRKVEMIDSLFKPTSAGHDKGIFRKGLLDFYFSSGNRKPDQIIIFRNGVSESQFNQVLNVELHQIIEACNFLDEQWNPKFTLIIAQKNHRTRFFLTGGSPDNVLPGTVVDKQICHPRNYDFYMCAHAGMIGTSRPTHYHVLLDENNLNPDDLQELVHSLSYVYQRSTTSISIVAPIRYAHLAASQVGQFIKSDDMPETSSNQRGITAPGAVPVPELPKLHKDVRRSMFFC